MGIRYNADKTKLGTYYSTPVYQFQMKCHLCLNKITIKQDPGTMDYIITGGARRVEQRWDPSTNGQMVPDDWLAGKMLRDQFRAKKKEKKAKLMKDKETLSKWGPEMKLVEEREENVRMARLLNVQAKTNAHERRTKERVGITNENIFSRKTASQPSHRETSGDKKLIAVRTLGKASKTKQSDLLKSKGFRLVVGKAKERRSNNLAQEKSTSSSKKEISEFQNNSRIVETDSLFKESSNSLSMLFSQYDNCSDDNEET